MSTDLEQQIQELQAENQKLRQQLQQQTTPAHYNLEKEIVERKHVETALAKRVRELRCLNEIGREIAENPSLSDLLNWVSERIPQAMQYPDLCKVAIEYHGQVYGTGEAIALPAQVVNALWIRGEALGRIYIAYTQKQEFLDEESAMLGGVASRVSAYIENRRLVEQLRESEERYRQILDAITDMVLVKGPHSQISWANKTFRDHYGMTNDQLRNLIDAPFVEPDYTQQYIKDDAYVFNTGQVLNIPEEPAIRYDGHVITVHTVKSPIFDGEGRVVATVGVSRDISERKLAEEALAKRATELQTVAQVSTAASTTLDVQKLLQEVVDLTQSRFNLYHAHIYLLDEAGNNLHLAAGAAEVGRRMAAEKWHIPLSQERSLVVQAARTRQGVIVNDVRQSPDFLPNPLLPDTGSEMAVPMIVGNRVLGVLDVQSNKLNHFTQEDVRIQTILATQVAVALQNAQQYEQTEAALAETAWLYQISTQLNAATTIKELFDAAVTPAIASGATNANLIIFELNPADQPEWAEVTEAFAVDPVLPVGARIYLPESPLPKLWSAEWERVILLGDVAQDERLDAAIRAMLLESQMVAGVIMSLTIGQRRIGQIMLGWDSPQTFTQGDQRLYDAIATQAATIIDNQLLLEQVRRRAERERLVNAIALKIQGTTTVQSALQMAVRELGEAFQARSTQIKLGAAKEIGLNGG